MPNKRKPNALKRLEGTDRPDRMYGEPEFGPVDEDIDPPDWLGEEGVDLWSRLMPMLRKNRVLTNADLTALAHLCKTHEQIVEKYRTGQEPTAAKLTQMRLQFTEFGLTPASRSKVGQSGESDEANPFSGLSTNGGGDG